MQDAATSSGGGFLPTAVAAMTLQDGVYRARSEDPKAFQHGLIFVLIVGLIVALASVAGAALTQWTSPSMPAIRDAVMEGVMDMPWTEQVPPDVLPEVQQQMRQNMETVFRIIEGVTPGIPQALAGILFQPLGMIVFWLVFGLLAHAFARVLDGTGTLAQTYGATSLSAAPQVLGVVHVLPYVQVAGLGTWSIICAYVAIKQAHGLSPWRAFWAVLLPFAVFALLAAMIGVAVGVFVAGLVAALGGAR